MRAAARSSGLHAWQVLRAPEKTVGRLGGVGRGPGFRAHWSGRALVSRALGGSRTGGLDLMDVPSNIPQRSISALMPEMTRAYNAKRTNRQI